ncbi:MAG TPA: tetratricopeptide repeat protein [Gemmatimonadaceae bacterium]|jgi:tetratricopeptide (TPR) repeat protein|nr:tetratricopeptide repeat protein [Gemmatimonadaceae bacterium]
MSRGLVAAIVATSVGIILLLPPSPALAQQNAFIEALAGFTEALPGTYGDERVETLASLDRMERGLVEWDKTEREYESNILTIGPTASAARALEMHRAMGMFYLARGRFDAAGREFTAAAVLSPEPQVHLFRGAVHDAAGRPADALKAYTTAWTLDRADPVAAYMLADASVRSGSSPPPAALATLSDVVDRIAAGTYAAEHEPFIAVAFMPDDLTKTPRFVPWWYADAYAHLKRADCATALELMRAAAAEDPLLATPVPPRLLQGAAALRAGQVARAIDDFTAAVRDAPSSEAHRMLGDAYWLVAELERSIEHLEQAVRLSPKDERARLMLARVLEENGDSGRAERMLVETAAAIPSSARSHFRLGRLYAAANRTNDAVREYEAAMSIGLFTGEAPLLLDIGALYHRELDAKGAEAAFARAVAVRPNDGVAHRERGRALLELGRTDAAFVELAAALLVDSKDYESYLTLGQIHLDAGRYAQASRLLTRAIALDPDEPDAYYALSTVLVRSGKSEEAAPHLATFARLQALALDKRRRGIELSTARLDAAALTEKGEFDRAVAAWTRIVADWPDIGANHAGLAAALAGVGQLDTAAAHYERAVALGAESSVYRKLAALYERMGRPDAAAATRAKLAQDQQHALGAEAQTDPR